MKEGKLNKTNIWVGSIITEKVRDMEEDTIEVGTRSIMEGVMGCVQAVVGKKKLMVQFEDGQWQDISSPLLLYVCSK